MALNTDWGLGRERVKPSWRWQSRRPQGRGGVKKCPVLENPGQKFRLWQRKPWVQKRTGLLPKALEMTNFSTFIFDERHVQIVTLIQKGNILKKNQFSTIVYRIRPFI
jgi:hypothetical protein